MGGRAMRERMDKGELLKGLTMRLSRSSEFAAVAKAAGMDWVFLDMEHNAAGPDVMCQTALAARSAGMTALVRVPGHDPLAASRLLDNGADGIIVPHVDKPSEIEPFIERCRFAPQGRRSLGGLLPQLGYAALPPAEAMRRANEEVLICPMIESPEAVENAEAIAALDGVDLLLFGSSDLSIEMGIPGKLDDPRIAEAYTHVIEVARRHGKHVGVGGVYTEALLRRYLPLGFGFALLGADLTFVLQGARAQVALVEEVHAGSAGAAPRS